MTISKKFFIVFLSCILFIILTNILAFYFFYNSYLKIYLAEKIQANKEITLDYINKLLKQQASDEVDEIFSNVEIEFFDLLDTNNWKILLNNEKNRDIVINYLIKSWLTPKYIEEIIPTDNFSKVIEKVKDKNSPEYHFLNKLLLSIIFINFIALILILVFIAIFTRKTVLPILKITRIIQNLDFTKRSKSEIIYNKQDEIWLLVWAINDLNKNLNIQENIKSKLLADISHELKTPITSIQCYLEWILDWVIKLDDKTLNSIIDEMKRLISLVNKIMEYEKFDSQELKLNLEEVNISILLKELSNTNKKRLTENNQRIKISWLENQIINLDKNLFKQLVYNIISNFIKYAWNETILNIIVAKNYIEFVDNWKWIPASEIQFITEKFYQSKSDNFCDIKERWIWIWLNLVQKIIFAHDWKFKIKSDTDKWFSIKIYF